MPGIAASELDLDHVAVGVERQLDVFPQYADDLGGRWEFSHGNPVFDFSQLTFANGMRVEVLEPVGDDPDNFLRRFLKNGPGPHHMTFKVTSLDNAIAAAESMGYQVVGIDRADPGWQEAFLYPKSSMGIVIQFAQPGDDDDDDHEAVPAWLPPPPVVAPATLEHVAHAVGDLALGQRLFVQLLAGVVVGSGSDEALQSDWVDVAWRGPGRVRLLQPQTAASPMHGWLDGRIGRLHHLRFTGVAESTLERLCAGHSVTALDNSRFELGPEHNLGVRLLLSA